MVENFRFFKKKYLKMYFFQNFEKLSDFFYFSKLQILLTSRLVVCKTRFYLLFFIYRPAHTFFYRNLQFPSMVTNVDRLIRKRVIYYQLLGQFFGWFKIWLSKDCSPKIEIHLRKDFTRNWWCALRYTNEAWESLDTF